MHKKPLSKSSIPLALYIHLPWCVQKCPYCDFNSHQKKDDLPEQLYVKRLLEELDTYLPLTQDRELISIFFGGGTPSLFSGQAIADILKGVAARIPFAANIEITLEANPGTVDHVNFAGYREAGVNRLSLGVQSLQDEKLKQLGRIHNHAQAFKAIEIAKQVGFDNFNLDIMYGLPQQSLEDALHDVEQALAFHPTHFSWYQLTLEPNTLFYHQPPTLPADDLIYEMQLVGQNLLAAKNYLQYEVSAYSLPGKNCAHNRNYWEFGDYLGIGAGAHSKITQLNEQRVIRFSQVKHPRDYLAPALKPAEQQVIEEKDLAFEFMLNALRLTDGFSIDMFEMRTGLSPAIIKEKLTRAWKQGLINIDGELIVPSEFGKRFLNNLVEMFLPSR